MNFGSPFDILDLAEALILVSAGILCQVPLRAWLPIAAMFAGNLVVDRAAIQQTSSPSEIMAVWHAMAVILCAVSNRHVLFIGLIFACMFSLDGAAIAGLISDKPVNGLGIDFWNGQSTLHHIQFVVILALISQSRAGRVRHRNRAGNR